jgi:hypothetical protein
MIEKDAPMIIGAATGNQGEFWLARHFQVP